MLLRFLECFDALIWNSKGRNALVLTPSSEPVRASEKRKKGRDVNYLKSLILHCRVKKYDKRSFDSVPI
jgi:hypothetical protein